MKKQSFMLRSIAALFITTTCSLTAFANEVRVYNWSDYIDESILADFEKETGIKVVYDVYDSDEVLEAKLLAGTSGYDVVFPSSNFMARQIRAKVFQPLQKDKLPNRKHLWDFVEKQTQAYDKDSVYSVNYMWGTTGLGINAEKIQAVAPDAPLDSWELLFNPKYAEKIAQCGIYMLDVPDDMIPAALNYQGKDPNSHNKQELLGTSSVLKPIRPYIRQFSNSSFIDALANGDICLAVGYSGDIMMAADRASAAGNGVKIQYVIPKEGAKLWFDQMVILGDAPHADNAHTFINYLLRPEVIAKSTNYLYYANGNKDATPLIDKEISEDTSIYPDDETREKLYTTTLYSPRLQKAVTRMWTNFKVGK